MKRVNQYIIIPIPKYNSQINTVHALSIMKTIFLLSLLITSLLTSISRGAELSAAQGDVRHGATLYVSKLGDDSGGQSWKTAFHTIQKAMDAVPDDKGGHQVIIRPDTYVEANLAPAYKGAAAAYNTLVGDFDGSLGSGATGWSVIDSGDPKKGFKSWDWWGPIRASDKHWPHGNNQETFSSIVWDRWILRHLYTAGGDGGFFWDLTNKSGEQFTIVVEDCVGTGRAFGGGVVYPTVRENEPSVFRRCYFLALDWIGDTAAVLVGGWEKAMPEHPHAMFEDCTLVHPDNAVAISYASHCARARFVNCRMIVLNFTQPEMGGKSTGIICTQGARAHRTAARRSGGLHSGWLQRVHTGGCPESRHVYDQGQNEGLCAIQARRAPRLRAAGALAHRPVFPDCPATDPLSVTGESRTAYADETALRRTQGYGEYAGRVQWPAAACAQPSRRHQEQHRRLHQEHVSLRARPEHGR